VSQLRLERIGKRYGGKAALADLSVEVGEGEFFAILGPSGCGKSTALRIIAGFIDPDEGRVFFGPRDVTALAPERRDAAMVFQSYALFPHLDAGENVAFGLRARKADRGAIPGRVAAALKLVGLAGAERRDVGSLSGGEQQRVALARAIVVEPTLLLLDEPMSNLDPKLRAGTRRDLRALQRRLGITTLYVTHDQDEALEMADRVAVLSAGRLIQVGSPRELYDRPLDEFVATFVGAANVLTGRVVEVCGDDAKVDLGTGAAPARLPAVGLKSGDEVKVALRPENLVLGDSRSGLAAVGEGEVRGVEFHGPTIEFSVAMAGGLELRAVALNAGDAPAPATGSRVRLSAPADKLVLLRSRD
jgi:ABC-type Fe3+/spermidine/putrescine transport system ATPase subunit